MEPELPEQDSLHSGAQYSPLYGALGPEVYMDLAAPSRVIVTGRKRENNPTHVCMQPSGCTHWLLNKPVGKLAASRHTGHFRRLNDCIV